MTRDEMEKHLYEIGQAYSKLVSWNQKLRGELEEARGVAEKAACHYNDAMCERDEARKLAEEWRDKYWEWEEDLPVKTHLPKPSMPWEVEK